MTKENILKETNSLWYKFNKSKKNQNTRQKMYFNKNFALIPERKRIPSSESTSTTHSTCQGYRNTNEQCKEFKNEKEKLEL